MGPNNDAPTVGLDGLPIAALLLRDDRVVAVNDAYVALMAVPASEVVGRSSADLIAQFVSTPDLATVGSAHEAQRAGDADSGHVWCRVVDGSGQNRSLRVVWQPSGSDLIVYLLVAEGETDAKALSEALARSGGALVRSCDETSVLEGAAEALAARGFTTTVLLIVEGDELLTYGPTRRPASVESRGIVEAIAPHRPPKALLTAFNPGFHERRAAFFQQGDRLVEKAFPPDVAGRVKPALPGRRMVQAPLFVDDRPFGALVVTSDLLTPAFAGAIEMFAELVARAIESVRARRVAETRLEELTRLQGELVERERLAVIGEAAAVMAHEVRNPVAAILNAVAVLRRAGAEEPSRAEMYRVITEESAYLEALVQNLLDLGRPMVPHLEALDLARIAEITVATLKSRHEGEGRIVVLGPDRGPAVANADPHLVQIALANLVRNALQVTPPGKRVVIGAETLRGRPALIVDDEGPGFSEQVVVRMFEPFFTTRAKGTGIGLAVVRRVIEANRGAIEIDRTPAGGGRVVLFFPPA